MTKYLIVLYALCFPNALNAEIDPCLTQEYHCNTAELYWHIDSMEENILGTYGIQQWYFYHKNLPKKVTKNKPLKLTVNPDGSSHWGQ